MAPKKHKREASRVGAKVEIAHSVPKTKRVCAGLQGKVIASTTQTMTVELEVQADAMALYSDHLDASSACRLKISAKHAITHKPRAVPTVPFNLLAFQVRLGELLSWQSLLPLYAAGHGVVTHDAIRDALRTAMRRVLQHWEAAIPVGPLTLNQIRKEWRAWRNGTLLKNIAYGAVRDVLVDFIAGRWRGSESFIPWTALDLVLHIGTTFDSKIIDMLLCYQQRRPHDGDHFSHLGVTLSHFLGMQGGHRPKPLGDYAIVSLVRTFSRWSGTIHWRHLEQLLEQVHRYRLTHRVVLGDQDP
jgi:hypothetical protein